MYSLPGTIPGNKMIAFHCVRATRHVKNGANSGNVSSMANKKVLPNPVGPLPIFFFHTLNFFR